MMKRLIATAATIAISLVILRTADAGQSTCYPGANPHLAVMIGSTLGSLVGSALADGRGQTLAIGAGGILGGFVANPPATRHALPLPGNSLVRQLDNNRNRLLHAIRTGAIPMPGPAMPPRIQRYHPSNSTREYTHCQSLDTQTVACRSPNGTWHVIR